MLDNSLVAARASGARLLFPGTIYNYGPDAGVEGGTSLARDLRDHGDQALVASPCTDGARRTTLARTPRCAQRWTAASFSARP